jgi:hypothetical protein
LTDAVINAANSGTIVAVRPEGDDVHIILRGVKVSPEAVLCPASP